MRKFIRKAAFSVGFDACGFAPAHELTEDAAFLRTWLAEGMQGDMRYLERNVEKRTDPRLLVPGCKTVIVVLLNYYPEVKQILERHKIAKYAYPEVDYHHTIREKLRTFEQLISEEYGSDCFSDDHQHSFIDSAPVLERRWAEKAGLGWIGKHTQLIAPGFGSYVFIATLMMNKELDTYDTPISDRCGTCTRCIDACPTQALIPGTLDARKCISYLTIETKSEIPGELRDKLSGYSVGCDICADVCPWNKKWALPHLHNELKPSNAILTWKEADWDHAGPDVLRNTFRSSAIIRALKNQKRV
jgi:epoxyqueuosine reductase